MALSPKMMTYKELAALGVKAIIDLRDDPMPFAKAAAEAAQHALFQHSDERHEGSEAGRDR